MLLESGNYKLQRHGRLTASTFGEVCKRRASTGNRKFVTRLIYGKRCETKAMRYGNVHESTARSHYGRKLATTSSLSTVIVTGVHIDTDDC